MSEVTDRRTGPSPGAARLALTLLALLGLALAPSFAPPSAINGDTSWLIHVVETLMNGGKAYVDVVETNPPMAFLIYWPAVAAARATGITPELAAYLFTIALMGVCGILTLDVARRAFRLTPLALVMLGAAFVVALILVPSRSFTQREHLALTFVLPALMSLAARADGRTTGNALAITAGLLAGLGVSIKPHFVLAIALPALAAALARRDWRILLAPEALVSGLLFCAYVLVWITVFPAFFDLPLFLIGNTYRLYTYGWADYLRDPPALVFLFSCLAGGLLALSHRRTPPILVFATGLAAFAVAFAEQGKGFAYHLYPVAAMTLLLAVFALALGREEQPGRLSTGLGTLFITAGAGVSLLSGLYSASYPDSSDLRRALLAGKPRPSLIILSFDIAVNFPLARDIGGTWSSRLQSLWISNSAGHAIRRGLSPEQKARTERAVMIERDWLAQDITRNRPDILVSDGQAVLDRLREAPAFRAAFDGVYVLSGTAQDGRFLIFRRTAP